MEENEEEEIDVQLRKDRENAELISLNKKIYRVLIKPNRRVIALFVPSHIQKIVTLNSNGTILLYDWDDRQTTLAPLKITESFTLAEVEQVQHGPSKQFYRVAFEFTSDKAVNRANSEQYLRIFFQVEAEALAFLEHVRKVYSAQKKLTSKRMFIIRKMTS